MNIFLPMRNPVKNYSWGDNSRISEFTGIPNQEGVPQAELWMGAHPASSSEVLIDNQWLSLFTEIEKNPAAFLGNLTSAGIDKLPFLFKILSAEKPLSIQCHPSKKMAEAGFLAENNKGIPLDAPDRNYKDPYPKPEIFCAITKLIGLCGFRKPDSIAADFAQLASKAIDRAVCVFFNQSAELAGESRLIPLTRYILQTDLKKIHAIPELLHITRNLSGEKYIRLQKAAMLHPDDAGLLFFIVLELFHLNPGEALLIPSGVLHSYLEGFGLEAMLNSDNVLRGGLTDKHIDIPELINNLDPDAGIKTFKPDPKKNITVYPSVSESFEIYRYSSENKNSNFPIIKTTIPAILLCTAGRGELKSATGETQLFKKGESVFIRPGTSAVELHLNGEAFTAG